VSESDEPKRDTTESGSQSESAEPESTDADPERTTNELFPPQRVHLIFGPSHAGKTILQLQIIDDWLADRTILDIYAPIPRRICYVSTDRPESVTIGYQQSLYLAPFPHISLIGSERQDQTLSGAFLAAERRVPGLEVLFIDSLISLCPGSLVNSQDVARFLRDAAAVCRQRRVTIIGTMPNAKAVASGPPPRYLDRIYGASSWSSSTDSKIMIDFYKSEPYPIDRRRRVVLFPWNQPEEILTLRHGESGRLHLVTPETEEVNADAVLDEWLGKLPAEENFSTEDVIAAARGKGLSRRTAFRWIETRRGLGVIRKTSFGRYKVVLKN
jgi:hypothetical protein